MTAPETDAARRSSRRTIAVAVLLVVGTLVAVALLTQRVTPGLRQSAGSGNDAPRLAASAPPDENFALPPLTLKGFADGPDVDLADLRGTPLVINFWATWCAPCVKEMPEFTTAAEHFGDSVTFLGVDVEDAPSNAEPFVERLGVQYPMAIDPQRELYRSVGNFGMPTTLFVDPDGIVQYRHTGALDQEELRRLIAEHLGVEG